MVKYRIKYFDKSNNGWRVELSNLSYVGAIVDLNTAQGQGCTIGYDAGDDPTEPVVISTASFTIAKHNAGIVNVDDFDGGDMDWSVDVYKNNVLFWTGYLVPDAIREAYQSMPYDIQLTATDGLKLLAGKAYATNNWLLPSGIIQRSFISHLRDILFMQSQLGKPLPIRWTGDLFRVESSGPNTDAFIGVPYSPRGEGYTDFNGNKYSSYYLLENLLRTYGCRIYQLGGKWRVERVVDLKDTPVYWSEIDTTFSPTLTPVLTHGFETRSGGIGTEFIVDDGANTWNIPGVKKVVTVYEANMPENALPNGTFDSSLFSPFRWYPDISDVSRTQVDSLYKREGNAAQFSFPVTTGNRMGYIALRPGIGGLELPLPLDTLTMFKRVSFGFTLLPQFGFPYDPLTGNIIWANSAFNFRVEISGANASGVKVKSYTLNENGFWIPKPSGSDFVINSQTKDVEATKVVIRTTFDGNVIVGDGVSYQDTGASPIGPVAYITDQTTHGNIIAFLNAAAAFISANSGGSVLSYSVYPGAGTSVRLDMTINPELGDAPANYDISLIKSNTNRDGSIMLLPEDSKIGDVIQINFDKFQGVKLPDFSDLPTVTHALMNVFLYIKEGQQYTIDDLYFNFDENNEVYDYEYSGSKFSERLDYELKISSSTNGFYTTNIMTDYSKSYLESKYVDLWGYSGTLTDLFCRNTIRMRSKSLKMFEGVLLTDNFRFGDIMSIVGFAGKKFLPLSSSYNTENGEADITCLELNMGDASLVRKFYGSNDKPLSNEIIN